MRDIERFAWAIAVIIALGIGCYAGYKITSAYKDPDIDRLTIELEAVRKEKSKVSTGEEYFKQTLKMLVEGGQVPGVDLKGRPSQGD